MIAKATKGRLQKMEYKHCVNCSCFQGTNKLKTKSIGFCRKTGIEVKDTLSGCIKAKKAIVLVNNGYGKL